MTRIAALLTRLNWSQMRLARAVGVTQTTIWRLSKGGVEAGPMKIAINRIAAATGNLDLVVAVDDIGDLTASPPVPRSPSGGAGAPLARRVASGEGSAPREGGA